ncbi:MAG: cupin domain-containing protein [Pirellulales bacterium]|nr:cupin domain-containing protein [Pirellulales bacterium]
MKVTHYEQVPAAPVEMEGAVQCRMRCLVGEPDGAPSFSMRQFEVAPGGHTPKHTHPYEHEVFVLEGQGVVLEGDVEHPLRPGTVVYVRPSELHQFRNTGAGPLKFLCLIPHPLRDMAGPCAAACGCQ